MPQPVHYSRHIEFAFTSDAIFKRPNLAAHIVSISSRWNEMEARIATLLAALLGNEAKTGISMFFAITGDGPKRAVTDAILNLKLNDPEKNKLQEILRKVGERYADRNRVVHGAWGISPKYPDALLWSDIRETVLFHVDMMGLPGPQNEDARQKRRLAYQKSLQVWKEPDFEAVAERLLAAHVELHDFTAPLIEKALGPHGRSVPLKASLPRR